MSELEEEYGVELIAEFLELTKKPVSIVDVRNHFKMSRQRFEILLDSLMKFKLVKGYSNMPVVTSPIVVITPKGQEFLRRFRNLMKLLEDEPTFQGE